MKTNKNIFDYAGQVFKVFGFSMLWLNVFALLFGESAKDVSTMFAMGKKGLSVETMLEFFFIAVITVALQFLFFTDRVIKRLSVAIRTVLMFAMEIGILICFIIRFGWFPVTMWEPWLMFFLCFGISAGVSVAVSTAKEKSENRRMQEALQRLKEGETNR